MGHKFGGSNGKHPERIETLSSPNSYKQMLRVVWKGAEAFIWVSQKKEKERQRLKKNIKRAQKDLDNL